MAFGEGEEMAGDRWTSQAFTDTLGVIIETWEGLEGLWGMRADGSLSD
jgi:hypothetical protein